MKIENWKEATIGDVATIIGGGTPSTLNPSYWNGDIQWFTPAELNNSKKYVSKSERTITEQGLKESSAKLLPKGTVLLTTRASIGLTAILKNPACTNQGFQSLIAKDICCNEFLYYVIPLIKDEMLSRASGSTFAEISARKLSTITLQLPPLPEQQRIAKALSDVDALISTTEKLIQKKKNIKQGAMQNLLTGKKRLPGFAKSTTYKQTELGPIPEDWEVKRLEEIEIKNGEMLKSDEYKEGTIPVIAGGKKPAGYHNRYNRKGNTITISGSGANAGFVSFYEQPIFASDCSTINEQKNIQIEYLFYSLILKQEEIYNCQAGGAQPHIHAKDIKDLYVLLPKNDKEQTAIANVLSSMDKEIETLNTKLEKYRNLKTAMMQQLLTGKIRLV